MSFQTLIVDGVFVTDSELLPSFQTQAYCPDYAIGRRDIPHAESCDERTEQEGVKSRLSGYEAINRENEGSNPDEPEGDLDRSRLNLGFAGHGWHRRSSSNKDGESHLGYRNLTDAARHPTGRAVR